MGYRIPGSAAGGVFTLPGWCYGLVTEADADEAATTLRATHGREPSWQAVRGALILRARSRSKGGAHG